MSLLNHKMSMVEKMIYSEISKTAEEIRAEVSESYLAKTDLETIQRDFQTSITQSASEIRMDFTAITNQISNSVATNQQLLEEYILEESLLSDIDIFCFS